MNKPADKTHFSLDTNAPLSTQQKTEIAALNAMTDETIDYSDIPPLSETFWQNAKPNPFYQPAKKVTTVRVDSDVLLWLKSKGKGYQARMNAILRTEML
jgi:uncharacterized protein (DUF4415 family)